VKNLSHFLGLSYEKEKPSLGLKGCKIEVERISKPVNEGDFP